MLEVARVAKRVAAAARRTLRRVLGVPALVVREVAAASNEVVVLRVGQQLARADARRGEAAAHARVAEGLDAGAEKLRDEAALCLDHL